MLEVELGWYENFARGFPVYGRSCLEFPLLLHFCVYVLVKVGPSRLSDEFWDLVGSRLVRSEM